LALQNQHHLQQLQQQQQHQHQHHHHQQQHQQGQAGDWVGGLLQMMDSEPPDSNMGL
jgi:hypothetical protein